EKVRSLDVDADQPVEAFLRGFEDVGARAWRNAGVVDQQIEPAKGLPREVHEPLVIADAGHIRLANLRPDLVAIIPGIADTIEGGLPGGRGVAGKIDDEIAANLRQFQRDAATDAARRTGDKRHGVHARANLWITRREKKLFSTRPWFARCRARRSMC